MILIQTIIARGNIFDVGCLASFLVILIYLINRYRPLKTSRPDEHKSRRIADSLERLDKPVQDPAAFMEYNDASSPESNADALSNIGPKPGIESTNYLSVQITALKNEDSTVRRSAANNLAKIGSPAESAVPTLIELLIDKSLPVRQSAFRALGAIGPAAKDAVPALTEASKDVDKEVRRAAQEALDKIKAEK